MPRSAAHLSYPPLQQVGGELVIVSQVTETHNVVFGLGILHQGDRGQHFDLQALCNGSVALKLMALWYDLH